MNLARVALAVVLVGLVLFLADYSTTPEPSIPISEMEGILITKLKEAELEPTVVVRTDVKAEFLTVSAVVSPSAWSERRKTVIEALDKDGWRYVGPFQFCKGALRFIEVIDCPKCEKQSIRLAQHLRGEYKC